MASTGHFLVLAALLLVMGAAGVVVRRNVIVVFMCVELMLNAANLTFVAMARELGTMDGQSVAFFVMTVAAGEAAVGLAVILAVFRQRRTVKVDEMGLLKW